jgi:predicted nucleotidyltransferase
MTTGPRTQHDYGERDVEAARRVLVDLVQVLGSWFDDCIVVVGGWVPDLLIPHADEPHIGSLDVDLALNVGKLRGGRYAEIVKLLLDSGRYEKTDQLFRLRAKVDLGDGLAPVVVDVEFLKPAGKRSSGGKTRLLPDFRPLDADGCAAAFIQPERVPIEGHMISGAENRVQVPVASVPDFLIMKAYALAGRDKPKDAYDICFCLDNAPGGIEALASDWRARRVSPLVQTAVQHLRAKFATVSSFGPQQVAIFYEAQSSEEQDMRARRAHELVARFLKLIG